jgi:hypothetical protein
MIFRVYFNSVINKGIMGILLYVQSAAFIDDIDIEDSNGTITEEQLKESFHASAVNCWGAAGLYVITLIISIIQVVFNFKK